MKIEELGMNLNFCLDAWWLWVPFAESAKAGRPRGFRGMPRLPGGQCKLLDVGTGAQRVWWNPTI